MASKTKILGLSTVFMLLCCGSLQAEQWQVGENEFKNQCAACHGLDAKGDGPYVKFLKVKPKSLTTLAKNNQGVFPFRYVYDVVDGRKHISAHGSRDMPIWGDRYAMEVIKQYGEFSTAGTESIRCRILELVFYLAELQELPDTLLKR
jgi:hypothetical protein